MFTGKTLITIMGILLALLAVCKLDFVAPITEGFWGNVQLGRKVQSNLTLPNGQVTAMNGNYYPTPSALEQGGSQFIQVPSYQAILSPRFSNINYGADIKYNLPDRKNMAVPCDPLTFGSRQGSQKEGFQNTHPRQVVEGYESNPPTCGKGGYGMGGKDISSSSGVPPGYTNGDYQQVYDKAAAGAMGVGNELPVGTIMAENGTGQDQTVVWNNNLMVAPSLKSRSYAQSDFVRGDIHIVPQILDNWSVHPTPATDLNAGAMHVMNGDGLGNSATIALISASAGGKSTLGGVDLADQPYTRNMALQTQANLSSVLSDLTVTAFP